MQSDYRLLLTGSTGQLGGALVPALARLGEVIAPDRAEMDLADVAGDFLLLRQTIRSVRPRWIVNPAAYTAVDRAEAEPDLAYAVNRDAVRAMGEEAQRIGGVVLHFSTDYVFDGNGSSAYTETDPTGPASVYGASKLAGEQALAGTGAEHIIFRTSWVYGSRGKNFLLTILKLAREKELLRIVADQHGAPTWSRDLAAMTAAVVSRCEQLTSQESLADVLKRLGGVYHAAGRGETTWFGFAEEAVRRMREAQPSTAWAKIEAIPSAEYPTPAKRPANSRLNCEKLGRNFGWSMMDWQESLSKVLLEL